MLSTFSPDKKHLGLLYSSIVIQKGNANGILSIIRRIKLNYAYTLQLSLCTHHSQQ